MVVGDPVTRLKILNGANFDVFIKLSNVNISDNVLVHHQNMNLDTEKSGEKLNNNNNQTNNNN